VGAASKWLSSFSLLPCVHVVLQTVWEVRGRRGENSKYRKWLPQKQGGGKGLLGSCNWWLEPEGTEESKGPTGWGGCAVATKGFGSDAQEPESPLGIWSCWQNLNRNEMPRQVLLSVHSGDPRQAGWEGAPLRGYGTSHRDAEPWAGVRRKVGRGVWEADETGLGD
jgi:hypothetical protein